MFAREVEIVTPDSHIGFASWNRVLGEEPSPPVDNWSSSLPPYILYEIIFI